MFLESKPKQRQKIFSQQSESPGNGLPTKALTIHNLTLEVDPVYLSHVLPTACSVQVTTILTLGAFHEISHSTKPRNRF